MVAISLSGSGEGLGRAIARGYSTGNDGGRALVIDVSDAPACVIGEHRWTPAFAEMTLGPSDICRADYRSRSPPSRGQA